jgi:hypothetical protein
MIELRRIRDRVLAWIWLQEFREKLVEQDAELRCEEAVFYKDKHIFRVTNSWSNTLRSKKHRSVFRCRVKQRG